MRYFIFLLAGFFFFSGVRAQNLSGQWTGGFVSGGGFLSGETEYVLELEISGAEVGGHSYTYFIINGKRCYVICKLKGEYDAGSKSLYVTEISKVKSNTPPDFRDCLQTHMLTFFKQGETETLKGSWKPASESDRCGTGATELQRKMLVRVNPAPPVKTSSPNNSTANNKTSATKPSTAKANTKPITKPSTTPAKQNTAGAAKKTPSPATGKTATAKSNTIKAAPKPPVKSPANTAKPKDSVKQVIAQNEPGKRLPEDAPPVAKTKLPTHSNKLQARNKNIIKTIEVPEAEFTVRLYDNGQVDGDTVTLFFNGKLLVSKERLSTDPITLKIKLNLNSDENDLVMIAENLGAIPPNTALMVVTVGDKRYEVNITSTEQINGTVRFRLKE